MPAALGPNHVAWRAFRAAILSGCLVGCAAPVAHRPVGVSDAAPEPAPSRPLAPQAPTRDIWPELASAQAWPEAAPPSVALAHRRDGSLVHVRVEPSALQAYQQLAVDSPMPDGARVVAWHESSSGQVLEGYLLQKRGGAWSAAIVDSRGSLQAGDQHQLPCLRCHAMAPTDHLFGRRAPEPPASSQESIGVDRR